MSHSALPALCPPHSLSLPPAAHDVSQQRSEQQSHQQGHQEGDQGVGEEVSVRGLSRWAEERVMLQDPITWGGHFIGGLWH